MKLEIFNKATRTRMDIIRTYNFVQYVDEFNGVGSFSLKLPVAEETLKYLTYGNFILFDDGVVGIIKKISDVQDDDTEIEISGYLTNHILAFRSFLTTTKYYDTIVNVARSMVSDLMISNSNEVRNIDFIKLSTNLKYIPELTNKVRIQDTGTKLNEKISEMFLPYGFGYKMYPVIKDYDEQSGVYSNLSEIEFRVLKPVDRTIGNAEGITPVVFSFELSNLKSLEYEEDGSDYSTIAVVASEGTGSNRKIVEVGESEKTGYDRIELYVDARDLQSESPDGATITQKELEELMNQRGLEKLEEHKTFISFDGSIVDGNMQYEYGKDFYNGDYVSIIDKHLGKTFNLQIVSVTKSISNGVEYFDLTFGYDRYTVKNMTSNSGGTTSVVSGGGGTGSTTVSVRVNSTTTGEPGTDASVTNVGTDENVQLDFVIPRGANGGKGDKGDKGDPGEKGEKGNPGTDGSNGVSPVLSVTEIINGHKVTIVDTDGTKSFDVLNGSKGDPGDKGVPGDKGNPGTDGLDGKAATIEIGTVTTGNPGTNASVVNVGTENAAVLNFTIPRGNPGEPGGGSSGGSGGLFAFELRSDGHLYVISDTTLTENQFVINSSGHLIYTLEG